jgi:hypothetical protein
MPFSGFPPVYTPPAAAENAFAGKTIASADWNTVFTDIQAGINSLAQSLQTTSGKIFTKTTVAFSVSLTDFTFTVPIPTSMGFSRYQIDSIRVSGATATLTGSTVALFTAASGGGTQVLTSTATTVTSTVESTNNNSMTLNVANQSTQSFNNTSLFFRIMAANTANAAGSATVTLYVTPCS